MKTTTQRSLLIAVCSILVAAGVIGPGALRLVLLAIAGLIGILLAVNAFRSEHGESHEP